MPNALIVPKGTRYGNLTVIEEVERDNKNRRQFLCKCDCGKEVVKPLAYLSVKSHSMTCGCRENISLKRKKIDNYIGQRYGKLVIIGESKQEKYQRFKVKCQCDCGVVKDVNLRDLTKSKNPVRSCGCSRRIDYGIKCGTKERLIHIYYNMKDRCTNPNCRYFYNYGGRGIKVCDEWMNSLSSFIKWAIENGYSDDLTLDRIDNDGNYEPSNCRWTTMKVQSNNKRNNVKITYHGETHTPSEWSEITGISEQRIWTRYRRNYALDVVFSKKRLATRATYEKREKTT